MLYEQMLAKSQKLEAQIQSLNSQLENLPDGKIFCSCNGKYHKWYQTDGKNQIYIPKSKRALAEKLALKKYLLLQLEDLQHEKRAIDFYLRHHSSNTGQADRLLSNNSAYHELLSPYFKPLSQELHDWMTSPYEKNTKHPEQLTHKTTSGNLVRSKSEVIIDMFLHVNKIPFRYESALNLRGTIIFPDFTIRHPQTGTLYYWEHFGLMDDPAYYTNAYSKLQLYTSHGIIPSIQLITTYETQKHPLSSEIVEKLVKHYFL